MVMVIITMDNGDYGGADGNSDVTRKKEEQDLCTPESLSSQNPSKNCTGWSEQQKQEKKQQEDEVALNSV